MTGKPVAVVVGATSKWQSDGRNTKLAHGQEIDDQDLPFGVRWGVGGAIAQKFAGEGFHVVLTTRTAVNAEALDRRFLNKAMTRVRWNWTLFQKNPSRRHARLFEKTGVIPTCWF